MSTSCHSTKMATVYKSYCKEWLRKPTCQLSTCIQLLVELQGLHTQEFRNSRMLVRTVWIILKGQNQLFLLILTFLNPVMELPRLGCFQAWDRGELRHTYVGSQYQWWVSALFLPSLLQSLHCFANIGIVLLHELAPSLWTSIVLSRKPLAFQLH